MNDRKINYGGRMPTDRYLNYREERCRCDARGARNGFDRLRPDAGWPPGLRDDPLARRSEWRRRNPDKPTLPEDLDVTRDQDSLIFRRSGVDHDRALQEWRLPNPRT